MPWNEPNSNNNNDPWGGKKDQGPPNLDKLLSDFIKKLHALFRNKKMNTNTNWQPSMNQEVGFVAGIIALVIVAIWAVSGLFIVYPAEEAVILRFGKYTEILQPGLHWFARFIETKYLVDVQKIYSFPVQGDFLTKSSDQNDLPSSYIPLDTATKKSLNSLDQSKNLINVELNVQYRISDPRAYLFAVVDPDDTIQAVAAGALSDAGWKKKID